MMPSPFPMPTPTSTSLVKKGQTSTSRELTTSRAGSTAKGSVSTDSGVLTTEKARGYAVSYRPASSPSATPARSLPPTTPEAHRTMYVWPAPTALIFDLDYEEPSSTPAPPEDAISLEDAAFAGTTAPG